MGKWKIVEDAIGSTVEDAIAWMQKPSQAATEEASADAAAVETAPAEKAAAEKAAPEKAAAERAAAEKAAAEKVGMPPKYVGTYLQDADGSTIKIAPDGSALLINKVGQKVIPLEF